ncbi:hypothetical protein [Streptomyces sediminimaris]|uniref:hypothetical protein n=1 Tax=Streptomyces sediminimaris TaxID=3383721 RepID=UPI00399B109F
MHTRTAVAACAALLTAPLLTACSSNTAPVADPAACKAAMSKRLKDGIDAGNKATPGTRPPQCHGVASKTIQRFAGELIRDQFRKIDTSNLTPDCHAWIVKKLKDPSGSIDATPDYNPCGYLTEKGLDKAIDAVLGELMNATPTP